MNFKKSKYDSRFHNFCKSVTKKKKKEIKKLLLMIVTADDNGYGWGYD